MGSFHVKWLFTDLGFPIQLDKFLHKYPSNLLKNRLFLGFHINWIWGIFTS